MRKRHQNYFRLHSTSKTPDSFDTRGILISIPAYDHSRTTENNNRQTDKEEILTNNQDEKYNSMKQLKGRFLFTKTFFESEVPLNILSHE